MDIHTVRALHSARVKCRRKATAHAPSPITMAKLQVSRLVWELLRATAQLPVQPAAPASTRHPPGPPAEPPTPVPPRETLTLQGSERQAQGCLPVVPSTFGSHRDTELPCLQQQREKTRSPPHPTCHLNPDYSPLANPSGTLPQWGWTGNTYSVLVILILPEALRIHSPRSSSLVPR